MWNFTNTEIKNTTQTQNNTHTMVTHTNESALTIAVPRHAFAEISFDVKVSLHDMRKFGRFIQTKEENKLFIIAKRTVGSVQKDTNVLLPISWQFKR